MVQFIENPTEKYFLNNTNFKLLCIQESRPKTNIDFVLNIFSGIRKGLLRIALSQIFHWSSSSGCLV